MNSEQTRILALRETDIQGAVKRCCGNETLYIACLKVFLEDPTMKGLSAAIANKSWDDAFTAAHALKGVAGNMGFVPLMHSTGQLVMLIRGGRTEEVREGLGNVESCYRDITDAIRQFISYEA